MVCEQGEGLRPLEELLDEVRLLWNRLVEVGEALHAEEPVSLAMRAVLEYLLLHGPTPVPEIARSRHVTRQHIQVLVNALLERGMVRLAPNPAHRRSARVELTAAGEATIRRMKAREQQLFSEMPRAATAEELHRAAETLRRVRGALGEDH